jgi:hypothetical protein
MMTRKKKSKMKRNRVERKLMVVCRSAGLLKATFALDAANVIIDSSLSNSTVRSLLGAIDWVYRKCRTPLLCSISLLTIRLLFFSTIDRWIGQSIIQDAIDAGSRVTIAFFVAIVGFAMLQVCV